MKSRGAQPGNGHIHTLMHRTAGLPRIRTLFGEEAGVSSSYGEIQTYVSLRGSGFFPNQAVEGA